jgi:MYXO-CTERM domain-containing protein
LADDSAFTTGGRNWLINYNDTTSGLNGGSYSNFVTVTAVPEPAAALIGGLGLLALLRRRR